MKQYQKITVPNSGKSGWSGGARVLVFVYSNKGNFVLEGYWKECMDELKKYKTLGYKYFYNITSWHQGQSRNLWGFWKNTVYFIRPRRHKKWMIMANPHRLYFKRLPKRWIPEFENL